MIIEQCLGKIQFLKNKHRNRKINKQAISQNDSKIMLPHLSFPRSLKYTVERS